MITIKIYLLFFIIIILAIILFTKKDIIDEQYIEKFKTSELVIIIPLRDREKNLNEYIKNMLPILEYQNINYNIYIIEQNQGKRFNKGKINNIGFIEALKDNSNYKRFLFNDVDNYPLNKNAIDYTRNINGIQHFFGNRRWLGGFFIINKNDYQKMNGYYNDFWGWGGEDNDLKNRAIELDIDINRDIFYERHKTNLINDDKTEWNNRDKNKDFQKIINNNKMNYKNKSNIYKNGINTCKYKILNTSFYQKDKNIRRILVDI